MAQVSSTGIPDEFADAAAGLLTRILASATNQQRSRGYMADSGKDMNPHELLDKPEFVEELALLGNRLFERVPYAKYARSKDAFEKKVNAKVVDVGLQTTPCWRCQELWTADKPECGCVKCKNNPKYYGSDLGAGTNYEPPTCKVYAASLKVFLAAGLRTLIYRYAYPRFELYGKVYKRNEQGVVVVDEEETQKFLESSSKK
jgi:hypothetical protein